MDNERFDKLAKQLATGASRRGILKGLFGGAAVVAAGGLTRQSASAARANDSLTRLLRRESFVYRYSTPSCGTYVLHRQSVLSHRDRHLRAQCAPQCIECCGPHYICPTPGDQCIHESHCCTAGVPGCPAGQICQQGDSGYSCVGCIANGQNVNQYHPCCSGRQVGGKLRLPPRTRRALTTLVSASRMGAQASNTIRTLLQWVPVPRGNCCDASHCDSQCVADWAARATSITRAAAGARLPGLTARRPSQCDGPVTGCGSNADCPDKKVCCPADSPKAGRCIGHGKDGGNRACYQGDFEGKREKQKSRREKSGRGGRGGGGGGGSRRRNNKNRD